MSYSTRIWQACVAKRDFSNIKFMHVHGYFYLLERYHGTFGEDLANDYLYAMKE